MTELLVSTSKKLKVQPKDVTEASHLPLKAKSHLEEMHPYNLCDIGSITEQTIEYKEFVRRQVANEVWSIQAMVFSTIIADKEVEHFPLLTKKQKKDIAYSFPTLGLPIDKKGINKFTQLRVRNTLTQGYLIEVNSEEEESKKILKNLAKIDTPLTLTDEEWSSIIKGEKLLMIHRVLDFSTSSTAKEEHSGRKIMMPFTAKVFAEFEGKKGKLTLYN